MPSDYLGIISKSSGSVYQTRLELLSSYYLFSTSEDRGLHLDYGVLYTTSIFRFRNGISLGDNTRPLEYQQNLWSTLYLLPGLGIKQQSRMLDLPLGLGYKATIPHAGSASGSGL
jgi:hypothetical protein